MAQKLPEKGVPKFGNGIIGYKFKGGVAIDGYICTVGSSYRAAGGSEGGEDSNMVANLRQMLVPLFGMAT